MKNLLQITRRIIKKTSLVVAATFVSVLMTGITSVNTARAEYYPARPAFDYNAPCDPTDDNIYDSCGSLTGPVFNSFVNTTSYGDERAFADARRSDQTAEGSYKNVLPDVTDGSSEVVIRTYVHNNANSDTNASGLGVAKGAFVRIDLPEAESNVLRARSYIGATNAALVEDTVDFTADRNFRMEYVPGSAKLYNNGPLKGVQLSDDIVNGGAPIGYDSLNGELPGCFEYEATVLITVRIIPQETPPAPEMDFEKQVRLAGTKEWKEEVSAKPGDTVQWLLTTTVSGGGQLDDIIVRDILPPHVELVAGSVKRIDASRDQVLENGPLFDGGYNLGSYASGSGFYVTFDTKVLGNFTQCQVRLRNVAYSRSNTTPEISDSADLIVTRTNCEPPKQIPNTGPGGMIAGIMSAVTGLGAIAHRKFTLKRQ